MKNVGSLDRIIRLVLGAAIIIAGIVIKSWWSLLGVVLILTALLSFCPIYAPFKISTIRKKNT